MYIIVSIGLNVGSSEPVDQRKRTENLAHALGYVTRQTIFESEWEGVKERTMQFRIATAHGTAVIGALPALARLLGQSAIAYTVHKDQAGAHWVLAWGDTDQSGGNEYTTGATFAEFAVRV